MAIKLKILQSQFFLRIQEIKYKKKFINQENLYPGNYIIEIAKKILEKHHNEKFENFRQSFDLLREES